MESRKAWRNREPTADEEVLGLIEVLRVGLGAERVGLFDDDRGDPQGSGALAFWDAFDEPRCTGIDWNEFYRSLRTNERAEVTCRCDAPHRVAGFLVHGRWALLLIGPSTRPATDASAVVSGLRALADKLPPGRSHLAAPSAERDRERERLDEPLRGEGSASPLFWVRKRRD